MTVIGVTETHRLVYKQGIAKENSLYNRDEHVKTANKMKMHDICILLVHNALHS